ncbi:MAG: AlpA family phage regulatory protein [Methylophaga sp.]|nr:AlpA family phage regulatory protein [Methylophaga sp.]
MNVIQLSHQTKYLTDKEVAARYSLGRSTIWLWTRENKFPKPRKLNHSTRWHVDDLIKWEAELKDKAVNQ